MDQKKLELLRTLAAEGYRQLDRGQGVQIKSRRDLEDLMDRIDRRAIEPPNNLPKGA